MTAGEGTVGVVSEPPPPVDGETVNVLIREIAQRLDVVSIQALLYENVVRLDVTFRGRVTFNGGESYARAYYSQFCVRQEELVRPSRAAERVVREIATYYPL